jgi:nucleoside-diphosphate-sugar epimerase
MNNALTYTILGANGFVGQALSQWLRERGHEVHTPARHLSSTELSAGLRGHVVYCIGLTADFRSRPWDTFDAHVGVLRQLLAEGNFASLTYLSSTRVYLGSNAGHEDAALSVQPGAPDQLFNLSKLMGESLCHAAHRPEKPVRVVRLSNVAGRDLTSDNFIYALLREALASGTIHLKSSLDSAKDYIAITDVIRMLELIARCGQAPCYNLASGQQTTNSEVVEAIAKLSGARFFVSDNAPHTAFPKIDIGRLRQEFGFDPLPPLDCLKEVFANLSQVSSRP